ncbi:MAG: hypothetical protein WC322_01435 [Candidatus Paceibacterota bacterium]|jgi:hypothetical protein
MRRALTYIEIDVDFCALNYGVSPCTAAVGVTGAAKCFNTIRTCQDRPNFTNAPVTLRFGLDVNYLPPEIECFPCLLEANFTPARISLGEDLGQRASLNVRLRDFRHSDTGDGFDKYRTERSYDPFNQGTFFGKFRIRQAFLRGRNIRLIRGYLGQSLADMDTRHYFIEDFDGVTPQGTFTITAKDVLKLADNDRAQAPLLSEGFLIADIDAVVTTATLSPSGIGDATYPASGFVAIGGEEIVAFTRAADVLTITRGQRGTLATTHAAQDRVQICLIYDGESPADIIYDLLTSYTSTPPEYIPLTSWQTEVTTYLQRLYGATIAEPTGVNDLISELVEQAALAIWWDDTTRLINLQVLRSLTSIGSFDEQVTLEGSLQVKDQPAKRITQVWTYYGQRNPLKPLDETDNFRSTLASVDLQTETDYGSSVIKKIHARWIPAFGQQTAERVNNIQLGKYKTPPRLITLGAYRYGEIEPQLGSAYTVGSWSIQDEFGAPATALAQITMLNTLDDKYVIELEESLFESEEQADLINRVITIDSNIFDVNLRSLHDSIYPAPVLGESPQINLTVTINQGVIVGASTTSVAAFTVGDWPAGVPIIINVLGRIEGAGGDGGSQGIESVQDGGPGGLAFYTRYPVTVQAMGGGIWGGGGGGGLGSGTGSSDENKRRGGSGGAGYQPGDGGIGNTANGNPGTTEAGGAEVHSRAGYGGDPGMPGENGSGDGQHGNGGAAGKAIDGRSYVTLLSGSPGVEIKGAEIN